MIAVRARTCVIVALCAWAGAGHAQSLTPFQQQALDQIVESLDPEIRPMMRAQLAPTLAMLNEQQVTMMLEAMTESLADTVEVDDGSSLVNEPASPADLEYNRAQFEPVIRRAWQAGKAFDEFVTATLAEHCARERPFAVFGSAWRYEVYPLRPTWPRASNNVDVAVEVIGASYAPQDGRYDFDFSDVRFSFDKAAVARGIAEACSEHAAIGEAFVAAARADAGDQELPPNGMRLESDANRRAGAVQARLEALLESQAPGGNNAVHPALLNGQRVDSD